MCEEYLKDIDFKNPKTYEINIKINENDVINILWHLKTLIRCRLMKNSEEAYYRYAFGRGKKDLSYMSRILFKYDDEKLEILCLLEDEIVCNKIFEVIKQVFTENLTEPLTFNEFIGIFKSEFIECAKKKRKL